MIPLSLSTVAQVTGGRLLGQDCVVDADVVTDSRQAQPGSLYVARVGESADGHDFVPQAMRAGAVGVLGSRQVGAAPTVVVPDVQEAFAAVARQVVQRAEDLTVVGITGSSGKTSTKDLLAQVLSPIAPTVAPVGSYNSEVGVPLTVCRVRTDTRYLVAEMGADGLGHIAYLCRIAPPQIGVVLNVGRAHLGKFGSVEAIARTKGELVEALPPDGLAVLNADDPLVAAMASRTPAQVYLVGQSAKADLRATDITLDDLGRPRFLAHTPEGSLEVRLNGLLGEHHVGNALSVLAVGLRLGVPLQQIADSMQSATPLSRWRMELHELRTGVTLVNDAYNANPDSMQAAIGTLAAMGRSGRRTWAVLGAMRELGPQTESDHELIGAAAAAAGIDQILAVGEGAEGIERGAIAQGSSARVRWVADAHAAHVVLSQEQEGGDVILLKSSRDSGLRFLGDRIVDEAEQERVR